VAGQHIGEETNRKADRAGEEGNHFDGHQQQQQAQRRMGDEQFQEPDAVFGEALDFDRETGILYLASTPGDEVGNFYTVDPSTGATTLVGPLAGELDTMAIAKSGAACATPADTPWLGYDVASGTIPPDPDQTNPDTVTVSFDASALAPGTYTANLCVYSNDLSHSRVAVPVHLTVTDGGAADTIFEDGFDT